MTGQHRTATAEATAETTPEATLDASPEATPNTTPGVTADTAAGSAAAARTPIRLLLADDQALVRGGLATLLDLEPDLTVVAQLSSGVDLVDRVRDTQADVALLDIEMPDVNGIEACTALRASGLPCRVLMVTTFGRPGYVSRALAAGAHGFVVKDMPADALADAVRRIHTGERYIDPTLAAETLSVGINPLTERERDVLRAALGGAPVRDIAARLHLSPGTVRNHLSSAIGKTHTTTRTEAALAAERQGWL